MPRVQVKAASTVGNSLTIAFDSPNTLHNLLTFTVISGAGSGSRPPTNTCIVTDSIGNIIGGPSANSPQTGGFNTNVSIFYVLNAKAGANSVTVTYAGGATGDLSVIIAEESGDFGGPFAVDSQTAGLSGQGGDWQPTITTAFPHEVAVMGYVSDHTPVSIVSATGIALADTTDYGAYLDADLSVEQVYSPHIIQGFSSSIGALLVTFAGSQTAMSINCPAAQAGATGTPYLIRDGSISGGVPPYTVGVASGNLPPGLKVVVAQNFTSAEVLISGLPTKPGTYAFQLQARDNVGTTATCSMSITITGADLSCPCGKVVKAEFTSASDFHYSEDTDSAQGGLIQFGYPLFYPEGAGCILFCGDGPLSVNGGNCAPRLAPCTVNCGDSAFTYTGTWAGQTCVSDITNILAVNFAGNVAAFLASISAVSVNAFGGNWDTGGTDFAHSNVLTTIDLYVTLTYENGGKLILRPGGFYAADANDGRGARFGAGLGVQLWQWSLRTVSNPWAAWWYNWPVETASAVCPSPDCIPVVPELGAVCNIPALGSVGQFYLGFVVAFGGTGPYTFALAPGSALPASLTLNANTGTISGFPLAGGAFTFSVVVTDSLGATFLVTCAATILNCPPDSQGGPG